MKLIRPFRITLLCMFSMFSFYSHAEDYETAIGIRLGGVTQGLTVKHFLSTNSALEGILSFGHHGFLITGLYEFHNEIAGAPGLYWYYGGGAHLGFYSGGDYFYYKKHGVIYYYEEGRSTAVFGVDLIAGLEYKFKNSPIAIGLDIKPFFDFAEEFPGYWDGALNIRFTF